MGVLSTVAYYFGYFDAGAAILMQIDSITAQVEFETTRRIGIERTMREEEEMRGNLLQLERNLEIVKSKIPSEFEDTQMSAILNMATQASGVNLQELSTATKTVAVSKVITANSLKPEDLIEEVKFNIVLTGSYESLLKFLDVLAKEDKIIKVRNFAIEKNSADIDDNLIKFKGEVIGYKQSAISVNPGQGTQ